MSSARRVQDSELGEEPAIEAAVPGEERIGLEPRMRADEEIRDETRAARSAAGTVLSPQAAGEGGGLRRNGVEASAEQAQCLPEFAVLREMRADLCPDDIADE